MATRKTRLKGCSEPRPTESRIVKRATHSDKGHVKLKPSALSKNNATSLLGPRPNTGRPGRHVKMNTARSTPNPSSRKQRTRARPTEIKSKNHTEEQQHDNIRNAEKKMIKHTNSKAKKSPGKQSNSNTDTEKDCIKQSRSNIKAAANTIDKLDAYAFDETDAQSPQIAFKSPFTKHASKIKKSSVPLQSKDSKKEKCAALSRNVKMKHEGKCVRKVEEKKTSTPLLSDSADVIVQEKEHVGRKRRSLRISVPVLNLDLTVTPILSVSVPSSPKQKARKGYDSKLDSFVAVPKTKNSPVVTPSFLTAKHKTKGQVSFNLQRSVQCSDSDDFKECVSKAQANSNVPCAREKGLKRKHSESHLSTSKRATVDSKVLSTKCTNAKRQKVDHQKLMRNDPPSKQQSKASKPSSLSRVNKSSKKQAVKKSNKVPVLNTKTSTRECKPTTSTPVCHQEVESSVRQPGNENMYCTPCLYDSGISMGSDSSRTADSSGTPSLPGFMEDEPLLSELSDVSSSPLSSEFGPTTNSTSVSEPASALNRSSSNEYKPLKFKPKRDKGRYSTSKMDAWASAMNQSLQDVESFELFVE